MKRILLALCAMAVLAACNNNKKDNGVGGNLFGNDGNNAFNNNNTNGPKKENGRMSKQMRDYLTNACIQEAGQAPNAKELCDCWVGKVEAKFANINNPQQIPEEAANQLAMECLQQTGGDAGFKGFDEGEFKDYKGGDFDNNGGYTDNDNYPADDDGGYDDESYPNTPNQPVKGNGKGWPAAQRQQWMMGCTTTAQQSMGVSQQQAASYCDCMTRKVEARYTFEQAVKMTAQDFSTPEWVNARMECQMNLGY